MAQWLACWAHNPKVRGSKPRSTTMVEAKQLRMACGVVRNGTHGDLSAPGRARENQCKWRLVLLVSHPA